MAVVVAVDDDNDDDGDDGDDGDVMNYMVGISYWYATTWTLQFQFHRWLSTGSGGITVIPDVIPDVILSNNT